MNFNEFFKKSVFVRNWIKIIVTKIVYCEQFPMYIPCFPSILNIHLPHKPPENRISHYLYLDVIVGSVEYKMHHYSVFES